jgi:predicted RNA binding protein YcfA (HicA-like mRNA interferase family)
VRPIDWDELAKLCASQGCTLDREKGDHYIMVRPGMSRPVVIPKKKGLKEDIVLGVGRTIGLNRKQIEAALNPKKSVKKVAAKKAAAGKA